jgi:hypothetical protein
MNTVESVIFHDWRIWLMHEGPGALNVVTG